MASFQSEPKDAKEDLHEINGEPVCKKIKTEDQTNVNDLYSPEAVQPNCQSLHVLISPPMKPPAIWPDNDITGEDDNELSTDLNVSCDSSGIADCDGAENSCEILSEEYNTSSPSAPCQTTLSDPDIDCDEEDCNSKDSLDSIDPSNEEINETSSSKKRRVRFQKVQVYYFDRMQGFTCVPSQGGSTLGMTLEHWHKDDIPLADYQRSRRQERRATLKKHYLQGKLQLCPEDRAIMEDVINHESRTGALQNSPSLSDSSDGKDDELLEEEELDDRLSYLEEFYFLQPVSLKKRRRMLKEAGTFKIERSERSDCQDVRLSRELCGCDCPNGVCLPETCECARWNIQCQVDRSNFPCACARQGCDNPAGRLEFNPIRVKTHFIHTQMRLEMERHGYDPSCESSECSSDVSNFNSTEQGSCRDCQNQSYMHAIVQELRSAGLLPPSIAAPPTLLPPPITLPPPPPPQQQQQQSASVVNILQSPAHEQMKFMSAQDSTQVTNVYPVSSVSFDSNFDDSYSDEDDDEDMSSEEEEDDEFESMNDAPAIELQYNNGKDLQEQHNLCYPPVDVNYQQHNDPVIMNYNSSYQMPHQPYCRLDPIDTLLHCTNTIASTATTNPTSISSNLASLLPSTSTKLTDLHYCVEDLPPIISNNTTTASDDTSDNYSASLHNTNSGTIAFSSSNTGSSIAVADNNPATTITSQSSSVSLGEILKNSIIETTVTV